MQRLGAWLGQKNKDAWAALPNSDKVRERARAIKDATLAELDTHLETLEASVERRGGTVHWAADGQAACAAVLEILQRPGATKLVQRKSLPSE